MKAKEKAEELVGKMQQNESVMPNEYAIQCAIIAVDEIIQSHVDWSTEQYESVDYWQQVKQELESL